MRNGMGMLFAGLIIFSAVAAAALAKDPSPAAATADLTSIRPISLSLEQPQQAAALPDAGEPESVYAPPSPPRDNEGINEGAVHIDVSVGYFTDYLYRGLELSELPDFSRTSLVPSQNPNIGPEDSLNLQVQTRLYWDLGKMPHPFLGVFVNYADSDPISTFQEVRPFFGVEWTIRPFVLSAGHNSYLYPNRDKLIDSTGRSIRFATSEAWGKIEIDDSYFLSSNQPVISPYIFAAYDYDQYNGWYFEAGVSHDFIFQDLGLTITTNAHVAYVRGVELFEITPSQQTVNGFQHYQLGLITTYSMNRLFHFPTRYGEWNIQGFLYYTDGLDNELNADTQLWGGTGILFRY